MPPGPVGPMGPRGRMLVLTMAAYNLVRMPTLAEVRPMAA